MRPKSKLDDNINIYLVGIVTEMDGRVLNPGPVLDFCEIDNEFKVSEK
jgi:hypothetical protein